MEYIYAALTIHKAGGTIDEETVTDVLKAAGADADEARVKALVAALDGVDIDDAVSKAAAAPALASAASESTADTTPADSGEEAAAEEQAEEEDDEAAEEAAAEGMGALFG